MGLFGELRAEEDESNTIALEQEVARHPHYDAMHASSMIDSPR